MNRMAIPSDDSADDEKQSMGHTERNMRRGEPKPPFDRCVRPPCDGQPKDEHDQNVEKHGSKRLMGGLSRVKG